MTLSKSRQDELLSHLAAGIVGIELAMVAPLSSEARAETPRRAHKAGAETGLARTDGTIDEATRRSRHLHFSERRWSVYLVSAGDDVILLGDYASIGVARGIGRALAKQMGVWLKDYIADGEAVDLPAASSHHTITDSVTDGWILPHELEEEVPV